MEKHDITIAVSFRVMPHPECIGTREDVLKSISPSLYAELDMPRRYAVACPSHGIVQMTSRQYAEQILRPAEGWLCPICNVPAVFDEANYEECTSD